MVSTRVYLPEDTKEALQTLAEERGTSQSALVREALENLLATENQNEEEDPLDETFGAWEDRENVHQKFREIRESMDRDVWARVREHHSENDDDLTGHSDDA